MRTILFDTDQTIFEEGDPGDLCFWIISGSVDLVLPRYAGAAPSVVALEAEDVFGERAIFDEAYRCATAVAREPTCCAVLTAGDLQILMAEDPTRAMAFLSALILRLHGAHRDLVTKMLGKPPSALGVCVA